MGIVVDVSHTGHRRVGSRRGVRSTVYCLAFKCSGSASQPAQPHRRPHQGHCRQRRGHRRQWVSGIRGGHDHANPGPVHRPYGLYRRASWSGHVAIGLDYTGRNPPLAEYEAARCGWPLVAGELSAAAMALSERTSRMLPGSRTLRSGCFSAGSAGRTCAEFSARTGCASSMQSGRDRCCRPDSLWRLGTGRWRRFIRND